MLSTFSIYVLLDINEKHSYSLHSNHVIPTFLESQSISSLTKIIERITKIYDIK